MALSEPLNRIHVSNLAWSIKEGDLKTRFSEFGEIETVKIPTRQKGGSKGFGFITFKTDEAAKKAVEKMNNVSMEDRRIGVVFSTSVEKKKEKPVAGDEPESNTLVVRNLPWSVDDEQLKENFQNFGTLKEYTVKKAKKGKSKGYGFVTFETVAEAKAAKDAMSGKEIEGRAIKVHFSKNDAGSRKRNARPKKKEQTAEKEEASPAKTGSKKRNKRKGKGKRSEQKGDGAPDPAPTPPKQKKRRQPPRNKLYVKISTESTEEDLKGVFASYGALKKVEIPSNKEGIPKGHAFVQFQSEEDANRALEDSKTKELKGVRLESVWARSRARRRKNNNNN